MIQEDDDMLNRLKTATLSDLYPEFDKENEWGRVASGLKSRRISSPVNYLKVAAVLLFMVCCGGYLWLSHSGSADTPAVAPHDQLAVNTAGAPAAEAPGVPVNNEAKPAKAAHALPPATPQGKNNMDKMFLSAFMMPVETATEPICNATKCALEICIHQTRRCGNDKPTEISDCRTLQPQQSGQLQYQVPEPPATGCKVSVDEIRITRVETGETIVINSDTGTTSAEEVLKCLTGEADCNVLAGIFENDCNDHPQQKKLKIDSREGDVIIR